MINPLFLRETSFFNEKQEGILIRFLFPLVIYGLFLLFFLIASLDPKFNPISLGFYFFIVLEWIIFVLSLLLLLGSTSRTITSEKENGTLEILLLTPISARGIVSGKYIASLWNAFNFVSLVLPLAGILIGLGGFNPVRILSATFLMIITLIGVAALGILFSALSKKSVTAFFISLFAFLGFNLLSLPLAFIPEKKVPSIINEAVKYVILTLNPVYNLNHLLLVSEPYYIPTIIYSLLVLFFSFIALNLCIKIIEKQRELRVPENKKVFLAIENKDSMQKSFTEKEKEVDDSLLIRFDFKSKENPIYFLTCKTSGILSKVNYLSKKKYLLILLLCLILGIPISLIPLGNYLVYIALIYQISASIISERESGFFQILLSTPFPDNKFIKGKILGFFKISIPIIFLQLGSPITRAIGASFLMSQLVFWQKILLMIPIFLAGVLDVFIYSFFVILVSIYISSNTKDIFQSSLKIFITMLVMGAIVISANYFGMFIALIPIAILSTVTKGTFYIASAITAGGIIIIYLIPIIIYLPGVLVVYQLIKNSLRKRLLMAS
ncbi:MAG: ABC transporter permease subunit [Candidatus Coatesbacteria bacterium]|nr:ABC transporter permease subunit [Candidatus Coatesbacteria bacterium]